TSEGTYGSILATLQHMVGADSRYRFRLSGPQPNWPRSPEETHDLAELASMAEDVGRAWDQLAAAEFDEERLVRWSLDGLDMEARAGILVAQALNHGNEHRAQIFTILTTI